MFKKAVTKADYFWQLLRRDNNTMESLGTSRSTTIRLFPVCCELDVNNNKSDNNNNSDNSNKSDNKHKSYNKHKSQNNNNNNNKKQQQNIREMHQY